MRRRSVDSTSLASVGYDAQSLTLEVEFHNGGVYHYLGVPPRTAQALLDADSLGAFLNTEIKPRYPYVRLELPAQSERGRR
jgi:hypothetical protein